MKVRAACAADLPAITAINRDSHPHPWAENHFPPALQGGQISVVEHHRHIIAFAIWQTVCDEAELHLLVTAREFVRQGAASALLRDFMRQHHGRVRRFFLEVRAGNTAARALYRRHGFIEIARRRDYYRLPQEDAIIMEKSC